MDDRAPNTSSEQLKPETAHVLFMDIVGYSKLASDLQPRMVQQLRGAVRNSSQFKRARDDGALICLPTGDGMALVFFGCDVVAPLRMALEISAALRAEASFGMRLGLHTGTIFRVPDINGTETVVGAGINFAQRVMDCGDAGHILMSQVHASFLREVASLQPHLKDIGEAEVKHGVRLSLVNYFDGVAGCDVLPAKMGARHGGESSVAATRGASRVDGVCAGKRVALIYKRGADPDETLLLALEAGLKQKGCDVFIDRHLRVGLNWAREIERTLRASDAVIPLLSPRAAASEMLAYELELSEEAAQMQNGRPQILPVRVNWEGPLPEGLKKILDPIQYLLWRGPVDTEATLQELVAAIGEPAPQSGLPARDRRLAGGSRSAPR